MKTFEDFSKKSDKNKVYDIVKPYADQLYALEDHLNAELRDAKLFTDADELRIPQMLGDFKQSNGTLIFKVYVDIDVSKISEKIDLPDYFVKLRDFFREYQYVKMTKGSSNGSYYVFLDFHKIIRSNIFKSLASIKKFNM